MYDVDDIGRSIVRYVAEMLGPPWVIDLERTEIPDDQRPAGLVEIGEERVRFARVSIPQGNVEKFAPVTVILYPSLAAPWDAGRTARHLAHGLGMLVSAGAEGPVFQDGRPASGPERIPLYDYADVLIGPDATAEQRTGPRYPHDVLWVEDYGVRAIQDPLDARRWSVILSMRVSWEMPGRVGPDWRAPIVRRMPATVALSVRGEVVPEESP